MMIKTFTVDLYNLEHDHGQYNPRDMEPLQEKERRVGSPAGHSKELHTGLGLLKVIVKDVMAI